MQLQARSRFRGLHCTLMLASAFGLLGLACLARPRPSLESVALELNQELVRTLRATVNDPLRLARAEAVAERIRLAEEFYFTRLRRIDERIFELDASYETAKHEFFPLFEELNVLRNEARDEMFALVSELKAQVAREEWPAVWSEIERGQARLGELFL